jgi:hypothetical protein
MLSLQVIQYAKDESIALKKTSEGWKSNKRLKAESKAAANKQARTEAAAEQQQGTAPAAAAAATPARAQVRLILVLARPQNNCWAHLFYTIRQSDS